MKQPTNTTLINSLRNNSQFYRADLYTFTLTDGTMYQWTTYDKTLTLPDTRVFTTGTPNLARTKLTSQIGTQVSTMELTFTARDTDMIENVPAMQFIAAGGFTGAIMQMETLVMTSPTDTSNGPIVMFIGEVGGADEIGRSHGKFTVNAMTNRLQQQVPKTLISASCPWTLFEPGCTLNQASFANSCTVLAGTTANSIVATVPATTNAHTAAYFTLGRISFTSGAGNGELFQCRSYGWSTNGTFLMSKNMGFVPAVGDTFTAYPGCDKTQSTCQNKFSNLVNFGGAPNIPVPETSFGGVSS